MNKRFTTTRKITLALFMVVCAFFLAFGLINLNSSKSTTLTASAETTSVSTLGGTLSSGEYQLSAGITASDNITVESGSTVTIDLNGYTLNLGESYNITNSGTLTITDGSTGGSITYSGSSEAIYNAGTLTLSGGTLTCDYIGILNYGSVVVGGGSISVTRSDSSNAAVGVWNYSATSSVTVNSGSVEVQNAGNAYGIYQTVSGGTITVNGGTISATRTSSSAYGIYVYYVDGTVNISGGTIKAVNTANTNNTNTYAVYLNGTSSSSKNEISLTITDGTLYGYYGIRSQNNSGELTVSNCTIDSQYYGIYSSYNSGELAVSDCTITSQMYGVFSTYSGKISISGITKITVAKTADATVYGVAVSYGDLEISGDVSITASSSSSNGYAVRCVGSSSATAYLTINGGTFSGDIYDIQCAAYSEVTINGGTLDTVVISYATGKAIISDSLNVTVSTTVTGYEVVSEASQTLTSYTEYSVAVTENSAYAYVEDSQGNIVYYGTLYDARSAAQDGDTIVLLKDSTGSSIGIVSGSKSITIDLNGYNITYSYTVLTVSSGNTVSIINSSSTTSTISSNLESSSSKELYAIYVSGTLSISGNINLTTTKYSSDEGFVYGIEVAAKGNLTIEDGVSIYAENTNSSGGSAGIAYFGNGDSSSPTTVTINGGTIYGGSYGISGNGSASYSSVTINGGSIEGGVVGYYHPEMGDLTITGGSITGKYAGLQMCAGTLNISGGTFTATATQDEIDSSNYNATNKSGDGIIADGAAISIINRDDYGLSQTSGTSSFDSGAITITGGSFTSASSVEAVQAYSYDSDATPKVSALGESQTIVAISGGTYSSALTGDYSANLTAEGFAVSTTANSDGTYGITLSNSNNTAAIYYDGSYTYYTTLAAAIEDISDGYIGDTSTGTSVSGQDVTIKLYAACSETLTIPASLSQTYGINLIIDLNGYTLSSEGSTLTVESGATLTIKDNASGGTVSTSGTSAYAVTNKGTLTIASGTIGGTNGVYNSGSLTIDGGAVKGDTYALYQYNGSAVINGGTFECTEAIYQAAGTITINAGTFTNAQYVIEQYSGTLEIYGGTFSATGVVFLKSGTTGTITVYGGSFGDKSVVSYIASGAVIVDDTGTSGYYVVYESETMAAENGIVAVVEGYGYATVTEALAAAAATDTIKLIADVTETSALTISNGTDITLNLNGYTLTITDYATVDISGTDKYVGILNNGTLTIEDSTGNGAIAVANDDVNYGIGNFGTLTIKAGTISSTNSANSTFTIYNDGTAALTVEGGTIIGETRAISSAGTLDISGGTLTADSLAVLNNGTGTINGGTISGGSLGVVNNGTLTISAGTISGTFALQSQFTTSSTTITGGTFIGTSVGVVSFSAPITLGTEGGNDEDIVITGEIAVEIVGDSSYGNGTVTMYSGTIGNCTIDGVDYESVWGVGMFGYSDTSYACFTMYNGSITADSFAISGNGSTGQGYDKLYIYGGEITSVYAAAIYNPQQTGVTYIMGGTITGQSGIEIRNGSVYIGENYNTDDLYYANAESLTIVATGDPLTANPNYSGSTIQGAAIAIATYNLTTITVSVGEGTYTSASGYAVYEANVNGYSTINYNLTVELTDGTYTGTIYSETASTSTTTFEVSGGSYSDTSAAAYVAEGSALSATDDGNGYFGVVASSSFVATVNGLGYSTLADAVTAAIAAGTADEAATIVLTQDVELSAALTFSYGCNVILDLNNHTISQASDFSGSWIIAVNGTLTIQDTSTEGNGKIETSTTYGVLVNGYGYNSEALLKVVSGTISNTGTSTTYNSAIRTQYGTVEISGGTLSGLYGIYANYSTTVTVTGGTINATTCGIGVYNESSLTYSGGNVSTISSDSHGIYISGDSSASITGGTITAGKYGVMVYGGSLEVSGSSTVITGTADSGIWIAYTSNTATVSITDGTISGKYGVFNNANVNGSVSISGGTVSGTVSGVYNSGGAVVITGGTIDGGTGSAVVSVGITDTCLVSGGSFNDTSASEYVTDDAVLSMTINEGRYIVYESVTAAVESGNIVAVIDGDLGYTTLQAAITAAADDDTVTLVANVTESVTITSGQNIVLDLNGYTLSSTGTTVTVASGATLTVSTSSGTISSTSTSSYAIVNNGTLTIEGGTISGANAVSNAGSLTVTEGTISATNTTNGYAINNSGTVSIEGGTITGAYGIQSADNASASVTISGGEITGTVAVIVYSGTATISGGTIKSNGSVSSFDYSVYVDGATSVEVTGGTYDGKVYSSDTALTVSGGTFSDTTVLSCLAENAVLDASTYVVYKDASAAVDAGIKATIGGLGYTTLQAAITAAEDDDTVTLVASTTESVTITSGQTITLEIGTYTITGVSDSAAITVSSGATLAITGTGTIQSYSSDYNGILNNGTLTASGVTIIGRNGINSTGTVTATDCTITGQSHQGIYNEGTLTVSGCTITGNNNAICNNSASGTVSIDGGTYSGTNYNGVYNNGGSVTIKNATVSGESGIHSENGGSLTIEESSVTGNTYNGIYSEGSCTITLTTATIAGYTVGIETSGGSLAITGCTISGTDYGIRTSANTTFTSGTIENSEHGIYVDDGATLTIEDITIDASVCGIYVCGTNSQSSYTTLYVKGGTISGGYYGIMAGIGTTFQYSKIYIYAGTITGTEGAGVYYPEIGELYIYGGTISGATGVEIRGGTVVINDEADSTAALTISGTGSVVESTSGIQVGDSNYGACTSGMAIAIVPHADYALNVSISSGTFTGTYAIYEKNLQSVTLPTMEVSVTGGTFTGTVYSYDVEKFISGGEYTSTTAADYVADEKMLNGTVNAEGYYTIIAASDVVATINGLGYTSIANAIAAAADGDTITLAQSTNEDVVITSGTITLYLNGKTLTNNTDTSTITVSGESTSLTITDSASGGSVVNNSATSNALQAVYVYEGATLTVENATLTGSYNGIRNGKYGVAGGTVILSSGAVVKGTSNAGIQTYGTVTVNDGATVEGAWGITLFGTDSGSYTTVTINGGEIKGTSQNAIANNGTPGYGYVTLYIYGGTITASGATMAAVYLPAQYGVTEIVGTDDSPVAITGVASGIEIRNGSLTISGNVTVTGTSETFSCKAISGAESICGAGLAISSYNQQGVSVTISGGTFTGYYAIYEYYANGSGTTNDDVEIDISGGSFTASNDSGAAVYSQNATGFISGGVYSDTSAKTYLTDEAILGSTADNDGKYTVYPDTTSAAEAGLVATVDGVGYTTLQATIEAAESGSTVTLAANVTENITISSGDDIIIDLGAYTLTGSVNVAEGGVVDLTNGTVTGVIYNYGDLYIYNSCTISSGYIIYNFNTLTIGDGKSRATDPTSVQQVINYSGTVTVSDGTTAEITSYGGSVTVSGGTVTKLVTSSTDVTISGGTIGADSEVIITGGTVSISGGTFEKAVTLTGTTATIEDGTFEGTVTIDGGTVTISGGTFATLNVVGGTVSISGGTFANDVSDYVADNYTVVYNGTLYEVVASDSIVAMIGSLGYSTLQAAIDAAGATATTITLVKDTTEDITIAENQNITLDLNGHTLTNVSGHTITVASGATLTIEGDGTVDNVTHAKAAIYSYGTVTLNGGTYTRSQEASTSASDNGDNSYYVLVNHGTMTINSGVTVGSYTDGTATDTVGKYSSLVQNGWFTEAENTAQTTSYLTINGGTFLGGLNTVKNDYWGVLEINDGTFINNAQNTVLNWGTATINGGSFSTTATGSNAAVICVGNDSSADSSTGTLTINGGTFTGDTVIKGYTKSGSYTDNTTVTITDGTFNGAIEDTIDTCEISGGIYTSTTAAAYVVDGSMLNGTAENGYYGIQATTTYVASIGSVGYTSLQLAINAASNGETVTLIADTTEDITIAAGQEITLDLSGCTLTNVNGHTITVESGAILTIEGDGTVDNVTHAKAAIYNLGTVTLNGGTYTRSQEAGDSKSSSGGNSYYTINNQGTMVINDGVTVTTRLVDDGGNRVGTYSSLILNGDYTASGSSLTIKGGSFVGGLNTVKNGEYGTLVIEGGTFTNTYQNVIMNWNSATISGGTFTATDTCTSVIWDGYYSTDATGSLTITGGTFTNVNGGDVITASATYTGASTVTIEGGEFTGVVNLDSAGSAEISGGTYSDTSAAAYLVSGYTLGEATASGYYTPVSTTNIVAMIGSVGYGSLADAINAAADGDEITLVANVTASVTISGKNIVLNLGGYTLTSAEATTITVENGATLTVSTDSGTIENTNAGGYAILNNGTLNVEGGTITGAYGIYNYGTLKITGGTISSSTGIAIETSGTSANVTIGEQGGANDALTIQAIGSAYAIRMLSGATVDIYSGTITSATHAIAIFGDNANNYTTLNVYGGSITATLFAIANNGGTGDGYAIINVEGGEITSSTEAAIYLPAQYGVTTISGGTIVGSTGIEIRNGSLTITGGSISSNATAQTEFGAIANDRGNTVNGVALAISAYNHEDITVTISGGEFYGYNYTIYECFTNASYGTALNVSVSPEITGGTFDGEVYAQNATEFISGGYLSEVADSTYYASGYVPTEVTIEGVTYYTVKSGYFATKPEADTTSYEYTGSEITFLGSGTGYTVVGGTGTEVGTYTVTVYLESGYVWTDGTSETLTYTFEITQATNTLTGTLEIMGWTYGETASTPDGLTADFGTIEYKYYSDAACTSEVTDITTADAGTYYVKAYVAETANYTAAESSAVSFTISQAANEISVTIDGWTYGETACSPEATVTGEQGTVTYKYYSDSNCTNEIDITTAGAGTYYVKAYVGETTNYSSAESSAVAFTIAQRAITITVNDASITYGDEAPSYGYTVTSGSVVDGDTIDVTYNCNYAQYSNVDTYTISATASNENYNITVVNGTLTVTAKAITVTISGGTSVYGEAVIVDQSAYTATDVVNNDDLGITLTTTATSTSDVGSYEITGTWTNTNYDVTFVIGTWTITKASVEIPEAVTTTYTYNGSEQTYGITSTDTYTVSGGEQTAAGTYTVTVTLNDTYNYQWSDGTTAAKTFTFTINKATVTAPSEDTTTYTYDGSAQTYTITSDSAYTVSGNVQTNAGTYTVTVTLNDTDNYQWSDNTTAAKTFTFTIAKASITAPSADGTTYTYNGSEQTYTIAANDAYTVIGSKQTAAGTYTVTVTLNDTDNYQWSDGTTAAKTFTFTINKATVTAPSGDTTTYTYTGSEQTYTIASNSAYTVSGNVQTNAGTYTVTVTLNDTDNYQWDDETTAAKTFTFTINKATVTAPTVTTTSFDFDGTEKTFITVDSDALYTAEGTTSATQIGTYNVVLVLKDSDNYQWASGATTSFTWTISDGGSYYVAIPTASADTFVYDGTEKSFVLATNAGYEISGDTTGTEVGTYTVTLTLDANHKWLDGSDEAIVYTWTITEAELTVTSTDGTVVYDGKTHTGSVSAATVDNSAVTIKYGTAEGTYDLDEAPAYTNAGTYTVYYQVTAENHTAATGSYTVTISKATYDMTGIELGNATATYNGTAHSIAISGTLPEGVTVSYVGSGISVGTYTIIASFSGDSDNYEAIANMTATLTITKASVTAPSADGTAFTYNGSEQTYAVAANDAYTVIGNVQTAAGTYTVTVTLNDTANYQWSDGTTAAKTFTFTIAKASVTAPSEDTTTFTYNGSEQTYAVAANDAYTVSGNVQTNAGTYTVTVTLNDTANYQWSDGTTAAKTFTFTIAKASITAPSADGTTYTYNGNEQTYTIAANDAYTVIGSKQTAAGTYTVTVTLNDTANYQWSDGTTAAKTFTFTIVKAANSVTDPTVDGTSVSGSTATYGTVTYKYYADEACTEEITDVSGYETYYVRAEVAEGDNYYGAVSGAVEITAESEGYSALEIVSISSTAAGIVVAIALAGILIFMLLKKKK